MTFSPSLQAAKVDLRGADHTERRPRVGAGFRSIGRGIGRDRVSARGIVFGIGSGVERRVGRAI
jgi:hypothetical protein